VKVRAHKFVLLFRFADDDMYITEDSIEIVFTTVLFELLNEELFVKDLLERADYWMVALTLSFVCFDLGLTLDLA